MCKNGDYINKTSAYIDYVLHDKPDFRPITENLRSRLPIALSQTVSLYEGRLLGRNVVYAFVNEGADFTPSQIKRVSNLLEVESGKLTIWVDDEIASYNVGRLVAQRVNFIIPQRQLFVPSLLIDLKKEKAVGADLGEVMSPMAQCLLLYHLGVSSLEGRDASFLQELFQVSYATINRALRWLRTKGLVHLDGEKTKCLRFPLASKELWHSAQPLLVSTVDKVVFTDTLPASGKVCGVNALAEYTMINPEAQPMYAYGKADFKLSHQSTDKKYGTYRIEIWRYAPSLLSQSETVDKLSLYLSLRNHDDERVQIELENMIANIQW